ncbi:MAG: carboxypeptidase-like regulatory domain-containing protein [Gemmataceae bacterium]
MARLTRQLGQALVSAPENADTDPRCRLTARLAEVQRLDKSLRDALGEYTRPFDAANVDRLIARSAAPTAGPIQVHALEGLLASPTPLVSGATRLGLWKARRALAQRLLEQTLRLDHQEDEQKTTTPAPEVYDAESGVRQQQIEALQRNRRTLGVAEAGGMAPERLEAVEAAATRARFEPDDWGHWGKLGALVRRLWNRGTPEEYRRQESLEAKRALAWIASPLDTLPHIDDGEMRIGARIRLQRAIALWSRLGGQYRYFARDFAGLGLESPGLRQSESFYRHAATVNAALVLPEPEAYARLRLLKPLEQLNPTRESVDAVLEVTRELPPGAFPPVEVALRRPDDLFFQASPDAATVPAARRSDAPRTLVTSVPCRIELKPGALAAAAPRPAGLLAAASFAGKTYHRVIAVPLPAIAHDVEILVSSNPKEPDPVLPALRVLPAQASEVFFVYVRNQLAVARKVNIELLVNDLPLSPGKLSLALAAGATLKAPLPDVAPPKEGLPELKGPLQLRVTDAETNRVLQSRTLPIDIAPPREHVEVRDSEYTPTAAVNKTVARRAESSRLESRPAVRIPTPAYAISAPGFGFAVEVDNPPAGATLDIGICRLEDGKLQADDVRRFPTPRQRRIGFWPRGPGGSLLLEAAIDDHHVSFDTSLIRGKRVLRARLLDEGGREILQTLQPILFDATAPSAVRFVDAPARARRGAATKLAVQALDPESGIRAVKFFVGKPQDEKPPRDAAMTTADPTAADPNLWTATLPLPEDGKGPTPITAHVINNAGLARFETVMVDCIDVDPATIGPARLRGKITEGDRPQAGMEVLLLDEMNREKARTRTKADGSYEFDKLEPGRYKVYSLKPETRRRALVPVRIGPNETKTVDLPLAL